MAESAIECNLIVDSNIHHVLRKKLNASYLISNHKPRIERIARIGDRSLVFKLRYSSQGPKARHIATSGLVDLITTRSVSEGAEALARSQNRFESCMEADRTRPSPYPLP